MHISNCITLKSKSHEKFIMVSCSDLYRCLAFGNPGNCTRHEYGLSGSCPTSDCHYCSSLQYHYRQKTPGLSLFLFNPLLHYYQTYQMPLSISSVILRSICKILIFSYFNLSENQLINTSDILSHSIFDYI